MHPFSGYCASTVYLVQLHYLDCLTHSCDRGFLVRRGKLAEALDDRRDGFEREVDFVFSRLMPKTEAQCGAGVLGRDGPPQEGVIPRSLSGPRDLACSTGVFHLLV